MSSAGALLVDSDRYALWQERLQEVLGGDEFCFITDKYMFGIQMLLFVHVVHAPLVSQLICMQYIL